MAEITAKKYRIEQLKSNGDLQILHPETEANIVNVATFTDKNSNEKNYGNVQTAIQNITNDILDVSATVVTDASNVTCVVYEEGEPTTSNVQDALDDAFDQLYGIDDIIADIQNDHSADIITTSIDNSIGADRTIYTIYTTVEQISGAVETSQNTVNFILGEAAAKNVSNAISSSSTDDELATALSVYNAIQALPEPMIFKGSLGTGGTISDLPAASSANEGYTYKVITDGTYQSLVCKVGDTVISTGSEWVLIPSGDEPSGTVTSVGLSMPTGFTVTGSPVTSSGTLTVTMTSGYTIPTTDQANAWTAKQDAITSSNKLSADLVEDGDTNHVFTASDDTKLSGIESGAQVNVIENVKLNGSVVTVDTTNKLVDLGSLVTANNAITPGTYSVVSYDAKGLVTAGGNVLEVGATSQTTPSPSLVVGGIFFKEI